MVEPMKDSFGGDVPESESTLRDRIYHKEFSQPGRDSRVGRYANAWMSFLMEKRIFIADGELLAGYPLHYDLCESMPFEARGSRAFDPLQRGRFRMDTAREKREILEFFGEELTDDDRQSVITFLDNADCHLYKHWHGGHVAPGYAQLLQEGFGNLLRREQAADRYAALPEAHDTCRAFQMTTSTCVQYIRRYAIYAREKCAWAKSRGEDTAALERMADGCSWIATHAPRTFYEALQLTWFAHEMMICENHPASVSFGRLDQYLYPFYRRDLDRGTLTRDEAKALLMSFWRLCAATSKSYQNLTLGGCDASGRCAYNDLTALCLEVTREARFDQPSVTFRCTRDMPEVARRAVLDTIETGIGMPALFWDESCIAVREDTGISADDSWNYAITGCVELSNSGLEYSMTEAGRLNFPKVLELMLNGGVDLETGHRIPLARTVPPEDLDTISSFDELFSWYQDELRHFTNMGLTAISWVDRLIASRYPLPYLSTIMADCVDLCCDVTAGGARYNGIGFNMCGLATVTDSLAALRTLVFEEHRVSLSAYAKALRANYEGYEELRQLALHAAPKFGNDNPAVDGLAHTIARQFCSQVNSWSIERGGHARVGLYTVEDHAFMGEHTAATPDGRLAGTALSNSLGAVQGKDVTGPTALANSVAGCALREARNGMVLDMKFTPAFLEKPAHEQALRSLLLTYFKRGAQEAQISVVDRQTLLAAQQHPEDYASLVVRVSGFSAYFTTLDKTTQDDIIARTAEA